MESDDTVVVSSVDENLYVAVSSFWSGFVVLPLKRLEFLMIGQNIFSAKFSFGGFFIITTGSVLERSKDCCWNIDVIHLLGTSFEESLGEKRTSLDGNWGELKLSVDNISNSINMRNIGLFYIINLEFSILLTGNTSCWKVDSSSNSVSTNGKENSVELFSFLFFSLFVSNGDLTIWSIKLLQFRWSCTSDKLGLVFLHEVTNSVCHILIKPSKENRSNHNVSIVAVSS